MPKRVLSALALAAFGLPAIYFGGVFYYLLMGVFLLGASVEYIHLFRAVNFQPQFHIVFLGVLIITLTRAFFPFFSQPAFTFTILVAMTYHLLQYERGRDQAGLDFTVTTGGLTYLGWIGSYLFDLRNLPDGASWFMLVMLSVWMGDTGAYYIGKAWGIHKIAPRLSPKKSWEGYIASIFSSILAALLFSQLFSRYGALGGQISLLQAALLGLLIGVLAPLGDFGESMIKRQSGIKNSSDIIPGHGGFFDRIDSWLWGAIIGYYFVTWFILK